MTDDKLLVLHGVLVWLTQTMTWLHTQVTHLPAEHVENHIVCERADHLDQFGVPNIHSLRDLPRWQHGMDRGLRRLGLRRYLGFEAQIARSYRFALLHSHFGNKAWEQIPVARAARIPQIVTFYGFDLTRLPHENPRWQARYRALFAHVQAALFEGPFMAQRAINLGCPPEKARVQHLGVRVDEIAFKPLHWQPGEPLRVLLAGTFREKKGFPDALTALGRLQAQVPLEITILGDANASNAEESAQKAQMQAIIAQYGLAAHVRMLGYQPHRVFFEQLHAHHLLLAPSVTASNGDTEGGAPVSLIEAQAAGTPIVSTTHCDIPNVVKHGETGLLADEHDIDGLVVHLQALVGQPERLAQMAEAGRRHVEREFNARVQGQRLYDVYREIASKTPKS